MPIHHHHMPILSPRYGTSARSRAKRPAADSGALRLNLPERDPALVEEYSWEWGNFPQKTPVWTAFGQAGSKDGKGKGREFFPDVDHDEVACE